MVIDDALQAHVSWFSWAAGCGAGTAQADARQGHERDGQQRRNDHAALGTRDADQRPGEGEADRGGEQGAGRPQRDDGLLFLRCQQGLGRARRSKIVAIPPSSAPAPKPDQIRPSAVPLPSKCPRTSSGSATSTGM